MTEESQSSTAEVIDSPRPAETETGPSDLVEAAVKPTTIDGDHVPEPPTLRNFFGVPEKSGDTGDHHWKAFQEKLAEETSGIKWTAAMPELGSKIADLLDIKIHDVLLTAWKKVEAVRQALHE